LHSFVVAAVSPDLPTLSWAQVFVRLTIAAALGGAIGLERELRERQAGLKTHLLVSVGSAVFTLVSAYGFREFVNPVLFARIDPTRIAAQIVSGIGFLGAGAIIRQGASVRGLTTAATLWLVAAVGMASGAGYYSAAVIATIGALFTLGPLRLIAHRALHRFHVGTSQLSVQLAPGSSTSPLIEAIERLGGRIGSLEIGHEGDRRQVQIDVELPQEANLPRFVEAVAGLDHVLEVRWNE
jgi:putative Mg2+ transporter-C (MgtC) family protein